MKIKQLGNGGGLDTDQTNSSFLIELELDHYLLVDCGFNVMSKLKELDQDENELFNLKHLKSVYITHTHEDHIGNLATLLYTRYFLLGGLSTKIYAHDEIQDELKPILSKCKTEIKSGQVVDAEMFSTGEATGWVTDTEISIISIESYHPGVKCYGMLLTQKFGTNIYISGDTKAYEEIEKALPSNTVIFHDFSTWNNPSRNVHACESEMNSEYSKKFIAAIHKYHTGSKQFDQEWRSVKNFERKFIKAS